VSSHWNFTPSFRIYNPLNYDRTQQDFTASEAGIQEKDSRLSIRIKNIYFDVNENLLYIYCFLPKPEIINIRIYDESGKITERIYKRYEKPGDRVFIFPFRKNVSSGIYFLHIETPTLSDIKKFMILR